MYSEIKKCTGIFRPGPKKCQSNRKMLKCPENNIILTRKNVNLTEIPAIKLYGHYFIGPQI